MHLSQIQSDNGAIVVVAREGTDAREVVGANSVYALAMEAIDAGNGLEATVKSHGLGDVVDLKAAYDAGKFLPPITHADNAHLHMTGTGLTHLGSASARDEMHKDVEETAMTDTMKMFRMGLENGKPKNGEKGVQPEWFYKGNGHFLKAAGEALTSPSFALDGGEEPELAGIYVVGNDGQPYRLGFAVANEFSDHVTERQNYLYLAHSKLRHASVGPEMLVGDLPDDVRGTSKISRDGKVIWEKPFLSGEANMSHTIENLEYHHFKYDVFRQAGEVHIHFFGTATLSVADGIQTQNGDVFEISAPDFGLPLRNSVATAKEENIRVVQL